MKFIPFVGFLKMLEDPAETDFQVLLMVIYHIGLLSLMIYLITNILI